MKKGAIKILGYVLVVFGFLMMIFNLVPSLFVSFLNETNNSFTTTVVSTSSSSYGMYVGFVLILIGVFLSMRKKKIISKRREVPVTENGKIIEYRRE